MFDDNEAIAVDDEATGEATASVYVDETNAPFPPDAQQSDNNDMPLSFRGSDGLKYVKSFGTLFPLPT